MPAKRPSMVANTDYDALPAHELPSCRTECGTVFGVGDGRYQAGQ